eukprot:gene346-371_t
MSQSGGDSPTSSTQQPCANPTCKQPGQKKCSGCSKVFYCSVDCQKKHWTEHKSQCKANSPSPNTTSSSSSSSSSSSTTTDDLQAKLAQEKAEIQKKFNSGDLEGAIQKSEEVIQLAKRLPSLQSQVEITQLYARMSSAFLHLNKNSEAEQAAASGELFAQLAVTERPGQGQAIELLTIALTTKVFALLANNKVNEAEETAQQALSHAESIFQKSDPRLHKTLRCLAMVYDRKGEVANAEKAFFRAYTILSISVGVQVTEAQLLAEDLVNLFLRHNDLEKAELYARKTYKGLIEKNLTGRELVFVAEAASRLASVLVRMQKYEEAEPFVQEALTIREEKLQPPHPLLIAYSLSQLAGVREAMGKVDQEVEALLLRAVDLFARVKGSTSQEVMNTLGQLRSVRSKLQGKDVEVDEVDDGAQEEKGSNEQRPIRSPSPRSPAPLLSGAIGEAERRLMQRLPPDDAISRMGLANSFYDQGKFNAAEMMLVQALQIFEKTQESASNIAAAKQNLSVVRNNRIQQLWTEVITEEVHFQAEEEEERRKGGETTLSAEEEAFLASISEPTPPSSSCAIC